MTPNLAAFHEREEAERWCEKHWVHCQAQPEGWWMIEVHKDKLNQDFYGTGMGFMAAFNDLMKDIADKGATESFRSDD